MSKQGKQGKKAPVAEPAEKVEQKPDTEVTGQASSQVEPVLNEVEELKLTQYENVIEQNLSGFMLVGRALKAIKDEKLYRAKFSTFEDYCHERWGLSDKHSYRLIEAYTCVDKLQKALVSPIGETRYPKNESQVRPLTPLVPEKQVEAWQQVLEACKGKPITADEVQNVVNKMQGQPSKQKATKKTESKTVEQKLVKIEKLVTKVLKKDESKLTVPGLKKILEKIQELIAAKK